MSTRILVVDDDPGISEMVALLLESEGYDVTVCANGSSVVALYRVERPDLVLLDVMLPGLDGVSVCKHLREESDVPIIMMSARTDSLDVIAGLEAGADDYVTKPFEPRELVARINSVLRRHRPAAAKQASSTNTVKMSPCYLFAGWLYNASHATLTRDQETLIVLSTVESKLLQVFLDHPNTLLPRERLIDLTTATDSDLSDRAIDRQVSRLRRKLAHSTGEPELLRTVWGGGYLFAADVTLQAP